MVLLGSASCNGVQEVQSLLNFLETEGGVNQLPLLSLKLSLQSISTECTVHSYLLSYPFLSASTFVENYFRTIIKLIEPFDQSN